MVLQVTEVHSPLARLWRYACRLGRRRRTEAHNLEVECESLLAAGWVRLTSSRQLGRAVVVRPLPGDGARPVLLWRTRSHQPVAMDSVCPHRQLSMVGARVVGNTVECPFHGRRFGPDGRCVNHPDSKPARVIEVREADGYLWCRGGKSGFRSRV
jgi:phenylpropionate dioxygenase-like ring-hydroxylating dioxygenase large terminal subunit